MDHHEAVPTVFGGHYRHGVPVSVFVRDDGFGGYKTGTCGERDPVGDVLCGRGWSEAVSRASVLQGLHRPRLTLHEEVVRDKLEKGFAHVKVVRTGQTGWVNNAHLVWRKSSAAKGVPPESAPQVRPAPPEEPATPKTPLQEDVIQAPSHPNPEIEGRDADIFNRF